MFISTSELIETSGLDNFNTGDRQIAGRGT